jgi:acetyl esterase/lipase
MREKKNRHFRLVTNLIFGCVFPWVFCSLSASPLIVPAPIDPQYTRQTYTYKTVSSLPIRADVYRKPDGQVRPAILWIHGGALIFGNRGGINQEQLQRYLESGFVVVSVDYRLAPETKLPEILTDLEDAYLWVREKGPEIFQVDPNRIAVVGHSAGGYLTLTAGYRFQPRPKALVSFYGYGDIAGAWYSNPDPFYLKEPLVSKEKAYAAVGKIPISEPLQEENRWPFYLYCRQQGLWPKEVVGHDPKTEPRAFDAYCPLRNVSGDYPPTLLLHGDKDTDVPFEQSEQMAKELKQNGVPSEFIPIAGGAHGFDWKLKDSQTAKAFDQVVAFLKKYVQSSVEANSSSSIISSLSGTLQVEIRDAASHQMVPARIYLLDQNGTLQVPTGAITYQKYNEHHFISQGSFQIGLPPGNYSLAVERGPEYLPWTSSIEVGEGQKPKTQVNLKRWIAMNQLGWYSADLHNHRKLEEMPSLLLAEDLNLAPTLTDWIWEDKPISQPPQTTQAIHQVDPTHVFSVLDKEVERLEWGPGAVDLLGLKSVIPFQGDRLFPPNDRFCRAAHEQGGYVDAEKIVWRDACVLVALGQLDFAGIVHNHFNRQGVELETIPWGMIPKERPEFDTMAGLPLWSMEVYYRFLNCGFRIPVSAGSASGVKASPLGYNRVYVRLDGTFSYAHWFRALKAGRSFGTNGPMLFLKVNGEEVGGSVKLSAPSRLKIHAEASSAGSLDRMEILFKGRVVQTLTTLDAQGRLVADLESAVSESGWVAARCFERVGQTIRFAHTSPVYVEIKNSSPIVPQDAQYFIQWIDREMEFYRKEPRFSRPEDRAAMLQFFERARDVYSRLSAQESNKKEVSSKAP